MRNRIRRVLRAVLTSQRAAAARSLRDRCGTRHTVREVEGVIQQVDPVGRQLPVLVEGVAMQFYVPLQCTICLNNAPVKLRFLQPQDRARLAYSIEHGISTVHSITVQSCTGRLPESP